VLRAEDAWIAGSRPKLAPLFHAITADVQAGIRVARPEVQHKGAAVRAGITVRKSNSAKKAWATRRRNSAEAVEIIDRLTAPRGAS
jgi:hypothetical protein